MLSVSVNYAEKMTRQMIRLIPPTQMQATKQTLKANIMKNYEFKEKILLNKHNVDIYDYSEALRTYENDQVIKKNTAELLEMMEKASNGEYPDLNVDPQVKMKLFRQ